jgi:protoporphyrinogen IX oxidase
MADFYPWIKALHVIAIISFMAGMLYLPRLFVYHAAAPKMSSEAETFKVMERKLERFIMLPALILTWVTGLDLAFTSGFIHAPWLHAKLGLVVLLTANYIYLAWTRLKLERGESRHSPKFFKAINEIPTLLMIAIVILVVVKP